MLTKHDRIITRPVPCLRHFIDAGCIQRGVKTTPILDQPQFQRSFGRVPWEKLRHRNGILPGVT